MMSLRYSCLPGHARDWTVILMILLLFGLETGATVATALAADLKILTPPPGANILARNPQTHLVLALPAAAEAVRVRVGQSGQAFAPKVAMEGEQDVYLHFRLPLKPGSNSFTILPGGQKVELTYQRIQGDIGQKSPGKHFYLFHQDADLPEVCQDCHDFAETTERGAVGLQQSPACINCHANLLENNPWRHSTSVNQQCLSCHQQSEGSGKLVGFPVVKSKELCLGCHVGKRDWFSRRFVHGVLELGGCTLCHAPHAGGHRYQLWADGQLELCVTCHGDKRQLVQKEDRTPYVHGIVFGSGCIACHDPHATDNEFMLYKSTNELCFSCHPRQVKFKVGHPVDRHPVSAPREHLRSKRQLTCVGCHNPHGSTQKLMLIDTIKGARLCRKCHAR